MLCAKFYWYMTLAQFVLKKKIKEENGKVYRQRKTGDQKRSIELLAQVKYSCSLSLQIKFKQYMYCKKSTHLKHDTGTNSFKLHMTDWYCREIQRNCWTYNKLKTADF